MTFSDLQKTTFKIKKKIFEIIFVQYFIQFLNCKT